MRAKAHRDLIAKQRDDDMPREGTYKPQFRDGVCRLTLMSEAVNQAGLTSDDEVTEHYYKEEGVVVIDLGGGDGDAD